MNLIGFKCGINILNIETLEFDTAEEYLQYYERKRMEIDNLGRETKKSKYIM
jgi:hypothetical protein